MAGFPLFIRTLISILLAVCGLDLANARDVASLLQEGDRLDGQNKNAKALPLFLEADSLRPNDAEILRRIAKQYAQLIEETPRKAEKKRRAEQALEYAQRAVDADPRNGAARLSLAICYGKAAFLESPRTRMQYSRRILEEAQAAVRLSPKDPLAWHVVGRWHYEIANLNPALRAVAQTMFGRFPEASNEAAVRYLAKAVEIGPPSILFHAELGRAYAAAGRESEARIQLELALALPSQTKDDEETKRRARLTLSRLRPE